MATQTIEFRSPPSQTVTLRLFVVGSDTQVASAVATEATNRKGTYAAAFTDVPAAEYQYIATIGTSPIIPVASGYVELTLTTATFQGYDAAKAVNLSEVAVDVVGDLKDAGLVEDSGGNRFTAKALELAAAAAQLGDWLITRTFQISGGAKVPGVRMSLAGVDGKIATTGSSGIATIQTDDGTYTLRVAVPTGYEALADTSLTISGADSTATVTLVASTVEPPTNPLMSRLDVLCLDAAGEAEAGVEVDARIVSVPAGSTNTAFKGNKQTATSGADGIATFEAPKGAKYQIKRGTAADWQTITIGSTDVTTISSFIGSP